MTARLSSTASWAYLLLGVAGLAGFALAGPGLPQDAVYLAIGVSCVAAMTVGIRRQPPERRASWQLMRAGLAIWVLGDTISSILEDIAHSVSYPNWADACYLLAYPLLGLGLLRLIRGRFPGRDAAGLLDSAILTSGLGVLSWVLLARPTIDASASSGLGAAVGVAYPVADILLIGLLIRLVATPGARTASFRLLFGAVALLVAADTLSTALGLWDSIPSTVCEYLWLASYLCWGAAALHPSAAALSEPSGTDSQPLTGRRLVALASASVVAPGTLLAQYLLGARLDVLAVVAGSVLMFLLVIARMRNALQQVVTIDRTRARLQDDLAYQAAHDPLTRLPNRARAMSEIEGALNRAQRSGMLLGLLFIDLDGFKAVNDTFGHRAGDEVLREVSARLRDLVRAGDLVARLGGDEFVVLLEGLATEADALDVANRLVAAIAEPVQITGAGRPALVGASIGMAISQDGSTDADRLLHEADTAAYRAKAAGRGRVEVFDDALRRELEARAAMEGALRKAIVQDELVLHYQPVIELATGRTAGYEALVRWERPGHGLQAPMSFIPTAEESMLVCDLDTWVLRRATTQLAQWPDPRRRVSVNISGRHMCEPRVIEDVRSALSASGLEPRRLVLEITETVVLQDLLAIEHLRTLQAMGVVVTLDDFGTGYNSLSRLRDLPVDMIKIDRSFVADPSPSARSLLRLMIDAAHAFGLPVITEGVENPEQLRTVRSMGCEYAQGFHLGRPLDVQQVLEREGALAG